MDSKFAQMDSRFDRMEAKMDKLESSYISLDKTVTKILKSYLENLLGCSVDIGTPDSLRPHLKETVLKEVIRAI